MATLEKRIEALEQIHKGAGADSWPAALEYPVSGTPAEQAAFERDIDTRRARGQKCFAWPTEEYPTEDDAGIALAELWL